MPRPPSDRPVRIADAALHLIATSGLHSVTHRTIDARLGFPAGTTSYYARTRAELITRALDLLVERYDEILADIPLEEIVDDEGAVDVVTSVATSLEARPEDQIARYVLAIDLRGDEELHALVGMQSRGSRRVLELTSDLIEQCGYADPEEYAKALIALVDGLILSRLAGGSQAPIRPAVATFWSGMRRASTDLSNDLPAE